MAMKRTIAVDFDGVVHRYAKGWQDGELYDIPMPGAFEAITELLKSYCIFIHTSRDPLQVIKWFREHGAPFEVTTMYSSSPFWDTPDIVGVSQKKFPAVLYIDDRALRFTSWEHALEQTARLAMYDFET